MKASSDIVDSFAEPQQKIDGSADNVTDVVPNPYIATLLSSLCWPHVGPTWSRVWSNVYKEK